jgi:hypothetical protein
VRLHVNGKKLGVVADTCHLSCERKSKIGEEQSKPIFAESSSLSPKYLSKKGLKVLLKQ